MVVAANIPLPDLSANESDGPPSETVVFYPTRFGNGYPSLVSAADADLLARPWRVNKYGYCIGASIRGVARLMHRVIMARVIGRPLLPTDCVDHANGNRRDNRRENIRLATRAGNAQNITVDSWASSGHRGAHQHKASGKWEAHVRHNGKKIYLGLHGTQAEAARVAAAKRSELGFLTGGGK